jgi:leucyl aminopeptidase (aminopeptidase T)
MATAPDDEEARVDAQLQETEKSIEELQKKRAELLRAKGAIRWAKTTASVSKAGAPQPAPAASMTAVATVASLKALDKTLSSLEWSSFKKKEGEWTFLRNRDGSLVDALTAEADFVNQLRRGREMVVGRYRYVVSEDKFLNRYFEA